MSQLFSPRANTVARVILVLIVLAPLGSMALGTVIGRSSYVTDERIALPQPVPFSHRHHAGELGIDCLYCHTGATKSDFAGLPPTYTCMTCHSQLWTQAEMLAPVRQSLATNQPIRWNRIHNLPDYVFFSHKVHVNNGVGCTTCHGPVDEMALTYKAEPMTMGWCLDCHRDPAPNLRPPDMITSADYDPEEGPDPHALLARYGIETEHLTDCSICHR